MYEKIGLNDKDFQCNAIFLQHWHHAARKKIKGIKWNKVQYKGNITTNHECIILNIHCDLQLLLQ